MSDWPFGKARRTAEVLNEMAVRTEMENVQLRTEVSQLRAWQSVLVEALTELVRLKDLKDNFIERYVGMPTEEWLEAGRQREEYERSKPLAWEAARAALAQG